MTDTPTEALLPCPLCNDNMDACTWVANDRDSLEQMAAPMCLCGLTGPMYPTRAQAIAAWNNRRTPTPPATDEREAVARALATHFCTQIARDQALRDVMTALSPIRAAEIAAARAEGYAEGLKRARTVVQNTRDGMKFDSTATVEWRNAITGGFNAADMALRHDLDAIERGEHRKDGL